VQAAIAIRTHSGWGALVAIAGTPQAPELAARTTVVIADAAVAGARQPYHFAAELEFAAAARHIAARAAASEEMAFARLGKLVADEFPVFGFPEIHTVRRIFMARFTSVST
jgi:hypothetical protein